MAKICLSRIESSAFKISSYAGPSVLTLQDLESQQERTLGSQPVHLVIFTCKDTVVSGSVEYQFKC